MFTLDLHYFDESLRDGYGFETVRAQNIPQLGQKIDSDRFYQGTWTVVQVHQSTRDGVLSDTVAVTLKQKD